MRNLMAASIKCSFLTDSLRRTVCHLAAMLLRLSYTPPEAMRPSEAG